MFRGCSGMFRAVPGVFQGCSGVFRGCSGAVPGFTDTRFQRATSVFPKPFDNPTLNLSVQKLWFNISIQSSFLLSDSEVIFRILKAMFNIK